MYIFFSINESWGADPNAFFFEDYLQMAETPGVDFTIVPAVFWPMLVIWVATLIILAPGARRGIGLASAIGVPVLVSVFLVLCWISLSRPGAARGVERL